VVPIFRLMENSISLGRMSASWARLEPKLRPAMVGLVKAWITGVIDMGLLIGEVQKPATGPRHCQELA
jgi:hypothetical protein